MALHSAAGDTGTVTEVVDWRRGLPRLTDAAVTLRALRQRDAESLVLHLNDPRVLEYVAPAPATAAGFRRFIRWTHTERRRRALACFGIVPAGASSAVGIVQVWPIERDFSTAEWGFALGAAFWDTGLFSSAATLFLDAVFAQLRIHRLEARSVDANARGNRTFERLGAVREGVLRAGFQDGARFRDQIMWSILAPEWLARRREVRRAN
jgi:RimJ/RimL family protein N-acetyltransferase